MKKLNDRARRCCLYCRWRPTRTATGHPELADYDDRVVREVLKHFEENHRLLPIEMEVGVFCPCGSEMDLTATRPTGGGSKAYYRCPTCGTEGYAKAEVLGRRPTSEPDLRHLAPHVPPDLSRFFN